MPRGIDIEHFPTSETAQQMLSRVSPIYDNSYVGKWIFEVIGLEWDEIRALITSLRDQCYLERVSWGIRYWEQRYGIESDETKPLEARRAAVRAKRKKHEALQPAALETVLEELIGRDVKVIEYNNVYRFAVQIQEGDNTVDYEAVIKRIDSIKPSHLAYYIDLPRHGNMTLYYGIALDLSRHISITAYDTVNSL